jgi:regulator of cell morphogenesis and NO signaling
VGVVCPQTRKTGQGAEKRSRNQESKSKKLQETELISLKSFKKPHPVRDTGKSRSFSATCYTLPEDACNTFMVMYRKIKVFEDDLHKHVHLENNILFPKAGQFNA